ncbi:MAG TPA: hypothetical protein P5210_05290, partial [Draconibacterium sp.]|nr:hypothetical protein [Draconibacterium sp.]
NNLKLLLKDSLGLLTFGFFIRESLRGLVVSGFFFFVPWKTIRAKIPTRTGLEKYFNTMNPVRVPFW